MTAIRYTPAPRGRWLLVVGQGRLLLVDRQSARDGLDELWEAVTSSGGAQSVLDGLTRGGISQTPAFALVTWEGDIAAAGSPLAVIARGAVSIVVDVGAEPVEIDGRGVATWHERAVSGAIGFEVRTETSQEKPATSGHELRLESGMAWATHVTVGAPSPVQQDDEQAPVAPPPESSDGGGLPSETTKAEFTVPAGIVHELPADPPVPASDGGSGYDYLFGETISRTVEDAAVREAADGSASVHEGGSPHLEPEGDHDGKTAIGLDRAARQAARRARAQGASRPVVVAGPRLFIDLSSGTSEELTQPILIGRAPSVAKVSGGNLPRLVTISGPDQDISRNHVQVAAEGGTVVVTDLHSRNGTMVILPGRPPQQLRAGEPTAVIVGTVVDLGAGVTFTVREG